MANLNISFTPVSPAPANGYRVKYWNVNTPSNVITVTPNPTSSPVTISGVAAGCYSGTVESACSGGQFSTAASFNACSTQSCLTGTLSATGNCSSGQTSTFTLSSGNQATVSMTGFYYTGSGTRTITGALLDNSNAVIQNFTYSQTGSGAGTTTPSFYTLSTAGTYKLQVNQVNCSLNGSGTATMTVGNCQVVTPGGSSYCVDVTSDTFTEPSTECSGVNDSYAVYTFTLKDSNGNVVNAPSAVSITFNGWTNYPGGAGAYNGSAVINSGSSSTTATVYTSQALNGAPGCPCPCETTVSIDTNSFAASIASPNTVSICPGGSGGNPPATYNCVNGQCVQVEGGLYSSLAACQAACTSGGGGNGGGSGGNCIDPETGLAVPCEPDPGSNQSGWCYYNNNTAQSVGPFLSLGECQQAANAAGGFICNQCIA